MVSIYDVIMIQLHLYINIICRYVVSVFIYCINSSMGYLMVLVNYLGNSKSGYISTFTSYNASVGSIYKYQISPSPLVVILTYEICPYSDCCYMSHKSCRLFVWVLVYIIYCESLSLPN